MKALFVFNILSASKAFYLSLCTGGKKISSVLSPLQKLLKNNNSCLLKTILNFSQKLILMTGLMGLFFPSISFAKIHIEPYAGWSLTFTNTDPFNSQVLNNTSKTLNYVAHNKYYTGPAAGMRLGYSKMGVAGGIDFNIAYLKSLYKGFENFRGKETLIPSLFGLFASYKLPLMFRFYGSFIPLGFVRLVNKNTNTNCKRSWGAKLGVSYISLPYVSINVEYMPLNIQACENKSNYSVWSHTGTLYLNLTF